MGRLRERPRREAVFEERFPIGARRARRRGFPARDPLGARDLVAREPLHAAAHVAAVRARGGGVPRAEEREQRLRGDSDVEEGIPAVRAARPVPFGPLVHDEPAQRRIDRVLGAETPEAAQLGAASAEASSSRTPDLSRVSRVGLREVLRHRSVIEDRVVHREVVAGGAGIQVQLPHLLPLREREPQRAPALGGEATGVHRVLARPRGPRVGETTADVGENLVQARGESFPLLGVELAAAPPVEERGERLGAEAHQLVARESHPVGGAVHELGEEEVGARRAGERLARGPPRRRARFPSLRESRRIESAEAAPLAPQPRHHLRFEYAVGVPEPHLSLQRAPLVGALRHRRAVGPEVGPRSRLPSLDAVPRAARRAVLVLLRHPPVGDGGAISVAPEGPGAGAVSRFVASLRFPRAILPPRAPLAVPHPVDVRPRLLLAPVLPEEAPLPAALPLLALPRDRELPVGVEAPPVAVIDLRPRGVALHLAHDHRGAVVVRLSSFLGLRQGGEGEGQEEQDERSATHGDRLGEEGRGGRLRRSGARRAGAGIPRGAWEVPPRTQPRSATSARRSGGAPPGRGAGSRGARSGRGG